MASAQEKAMQASTLACMLPVLRWRPQWESLQLLLDIISPSLIGFCFLLSCEFFHWYSHLNGGNMWCVTALQSLQFLTQATLSYHQEQKDDCGAEERRPCDRQGCGSRWVHEYHHGGRDFHWSQRFSTPLWLLLRAKSAHKVWEVGSWRDFIVLVQIHSDPPVHRPQGCLAIDPIWTRRPW